MKETGETLISIQLTEEEAKAFVDFRKYQGEFMKLVLNNVFDTAGGSVTLHFDHRGTLAKIERQQILFTFK